MTRLLILENDDQDRYGIDTVLMIVPDNYELEYVNDASGLEAPIIIEGIDISGRAFNTLINLGEYRPFIG